MKVKINAFRWFLCRKVGNINIVYVTDFVLAYSLSYTRYSTIGPYDKKTARTTRVAAKHDTLNELVRLPVLRTASKAMQN